MKILLRVRGNSLTHDFDPHWNRGRRLPAEEETSRYWRMARKQRHDQNKNCIRGRLLEK